MNETLRAAAARQPQPFYMGSQFKGATIKTDEQYRAVHSAQYSLSTVGNLCKWPATEPARGQFALDDCNEAFAYARQQEQKFRGHNLCWGNDNPKWLEQGGFNGTELAEILSTHVHGVMRGVKEAAGGISPLCYDVVNEACNSTAPFKPNTWFPALPNYVDVAFQAARDADPDTKLFYNDYGADGLGGKSNQMYTMVASMVRRGIPIDGVGLQAHLSLKGPLDGSGDAKGASAPSSEADVSANIKRCHSRVEPAVSWSRTPSLLIRRLTPHLAAGTASSAWRCTSRSST